MLPVLTIVEDFLSEADAIAIRNEVLRRGFGTEMIQEGENLPEVEYQNVQTQWMPGAFQEALPYVFGRPIQMHKQAFRFGFKDSQLHNLVHADHCCAKLAVVYYMNHLADCQGGTAFWRHKKHGWEYMPVQAELDRVGYTIEELAKDWHDPEAWQMVTLAGARPNRLIVYPTAAFHSRWPWEGFGAKDDLEHARLIYCGFLDVL
jgi:hypothetical protein